MGRKSMNRIMGAVLSVGVVAGLAGMPLVFAAQVPVEKPADTTMVNSGITVNAGDPSDDIHLVASNADPSNHQLSASHPSGTADFVIFLGGISRNDGNNFTAPITASWHTQGNGSTTAFTASTGTARFINKYPTPPSASPPRPYISSTAVVGRTFRESWNFPPDKTNASRTVYLIHAMQNRNAFVSVHFRSKNPHKYDFVR
jgi:hypothetical protein